MNHSRIPFSLALFAVLILTSCDTSKRDNSRPTVTGEPLVIELPAALEAERASYERDVTTALSEVDSFFLSAGVTPPIRRIIDSITVFGSVGEARTTLAAAYGVPIDGIPESFSGTVAGRRLYLVPRESYRQIFQAMYPDWRWDERSYHALIVHELAHRADEEAAITRYGSADAMGPVWFFEGLAVTCARQFETGEPPMSQSEILGHVGSGRTPEVSYPFYGRLVRSLAGLYGMEALISRAAEAGFPDELLNSPGERNTNRND